MGKRYWEASGKVRDELLALHDKREACRKEMFAFAKRNGTKKIGIHDGVFGCFALAFDTPPDPKLWKEIKASRGFYVAKQSTKAGKALYDEMRQLDAKLPSGIEVNRILGIEDFIFGGVWHTAGCKVFGDRVIVVTNDEYKPPKAVAKCLKRISDLEFERLSAK